MAKEILDLYIEQGYPYPLILNYNALDDTDLEGLYTCYFESSSIGIKQFSVVDNKYDLTLLSTDTEKLTTNLEKYIVYVVNNSNGNKDKLLSGRIHLDLKGV